jgi:hypothetical protein
LQEGLKTRPAINGFSGGRFWILEERKKKRRQCT